MDQQVVVGVGNIYATESLFRARIHPLRLAQTLSKSDCVLLVKAIQTILQKAIKQGGTTLKDFANTDGKPGYFRVSLQVYGKANKPCPVCEQPLHTMRIQGRSTVFCSHCQH
jgi:formamidopyrimidine-DNA glycosylase